MKVSILKLMRVILSIIFFIPITFLLLDFAGLIPVSYTNVILYFQFVPSILKFLTILTLGASGFIIVLLLTVLFGRVYCSTICPLGFLQDAVNYISKKIYKRKRKLNYLKEQKVLRLSLLGICIVLFIFGIALAVNLIDPYSLYGRITANLFRPVVIVVNNILSSVLESFKIYSVYNFEIKAFNLAPFIISAMFFVLIVYMAYKKGRLYCNTICPVGTLLGLISKFSFFKIIIEKEECLSCGKCERDCKGSCINSEEKIVDVSRCVACFNCVNSCPTGGIKFKFSPARKQTGNRVVDQTKRNFLISTGIYFAALSPIMAQVKKQIKVTKLSTIPIFRKHAISPPGSISLRKFNSKCTACSLCVNSCPTQVLQPSFLEYGFLGMQQPRMDNNAGFCNFDCTICGDICPTGAILPLSKEEKQLVRIGKVKFVEDNCIVKTQGTDCGACSEHCPTKAVHMIPYKNKLVIPEVREEYCVGCGACEFACPVKPYKAIYVEGNEVHLKAKKNVENEKPIEKIDYKEEFPF